MVQYVLTVAHDGRYDIDAMLAPDDPYDSSEFARMDEEHPLEPPPAGELVPEDGCELNEDEFNEVYANPCAACPCLR